MHQNSSSSPLEHWKLGIQFGTIWSLWRTEFWTTERFTGQRMVQQMVNRCFTSNQKIIQDNGWYLNIITSITNLRFTNFIILDIFCSFSFPGDSNWVVLVVGETLLNINAWRNVLIIANPGWSTLEEDLGRMDLGKEMDYKKIEH